MSENMDNIAATLGKLAKALQEGKAGKSVDASTLKTINDKLNLLINLLNRNVIVKLEKIEQYVDAKAKEMGLKLEAKPPVTPPPETPSAKGDLPKPSIPAPAPSVPPPKKEPEHAKTPAPPAVIPPASKPTMNQLKDQLGNLERQITDLEFQYKSGFVNDAEYAKKKKELSEKRERVIKQIGIG